MKKMKALIVEDERMAQAQLTRLLESRFPDIEVVAATGSVHDTVAYLAADPPIDIIFSESTKQPFTIRNNQFINVE